MCLASDLGAMVELDQSVYPLSIFATPGTTYVLEMPAAKARESDLPVIGRIERKPRLIITRGSSTLVDLPVAELAEAWRAPLATGGAR